MERPTRVYSREQLLDCVWGHDIYVKERTVDVHIRSLRKALNGDDGQNLIRTVRGGGYSLDETPKIFYNNSYSDGWTGLLREVKLE